MYNLNEYEWRDTDSELGIYSSLCTTNDGETIGFENRGFALRSKPPHVKEGGIHSGYGFLDSPLMTDGTQWSELTL